MNIKKTELQNQLLLLLGCLGIMLFVVIAAGSVRAHYEATVPQTQELQYTGTPSAVYLLSSERDASGNLLTDSSGYYKSLGDWVPLKDAQGAEIPNAYELEFLISNRKSPGSSTNTDSESTLEQQVSLVLFATVGIEAPEKLMVVLEDGGSVYTAYPAAVKEGSAWYQTYGPGWTYRFYNEAKEELTWSLSEGVFSYRQMKLIVKGSSEKAAALSLIATARPSSK